MIELTTDAIAATMPNSENVSRQPIAIRQPSNANAIAAWSTRVSMPVLRRVLRFLIRVAELVKDIFLRTNENDHS